VFRAHDELLQRDVALKLLHENVVGEVALRERILAEARAASALNHPGITTIYEVAEAKGRLFIVMELVHGGTLRSRLSSGPLEIREIARLGGQIAGALEAAHSRGVVHGDIKPENIVVQADGGAKLFDFGIARQIAAETALTRSVSPDTEMVPSKVAGTLAYMAPEVLRGDFSDARADLYSLGVVLFELATARRPFQAPTLTALIAGSQRARAVPG
jgi:eukaryotic-like serine/threonine-protein kinase